MAKRTTRYERTLDRLKNNRFVVAILIGVAAISGISIFTDQLRSLLTVVSSVIQAPPQPVAAVQFSRIVLAASVAHWRSVAMTEENYHLERNKRLFRDDPSFLKELENDKKAGNYTCPYLFENNDWCRKAKGFFSQRDLQEIAIDPEFDILVTNSLNSSVVLHSIGIEIVYASHVTVTLGTWQTTRVKVDGKYVVQMPLPPTRIRVDNDLVDIGAEVNDRLKSGLPVTAEFVRGLLLALDYEWPNIPIRVLADPQDPIYLPPEGPYRFNVVLREYHRMPNNVVLRFVLGTNRGEVLSDYFYLLAL
jgi:hypothetical protein